jgi:DNA polymerase-3 subunit gamma/tau
MMEAVNANHSAEVMTTANQLLDAGNSPAQLARQCVRYLRNALIAKIAGLSPEGENAEGIGAELLQISPDEQRRAARTAALFGEEELTRFLQVMLRTFDELGYRQEQRFHFELGLLKLVHLRRLLPIEEVLSQSGPSGRPSTASSAPRTTPASTPRSATPALRSAPAAQPAFSPFEQDKRRRPEGAASTPISVSAVASQPVMETRGATAVSVAPASRPAIEAVAIPMPIPAPVKLPEPMPFTMPSPLEERIEQQPNVTLPSPVFETAAPLVPPAAPAPAAPPAVAQQTVVDALTAAKQTSAADHMADALWTIANSEATVQTELSPKMLPVVMNAEAEKIARAALRTTGILKLTLLPGSPAPAAEKKTRAPRSGSVQAKALEHPMVQQAQKLFQAEIQTVIDLREND